MLVDNNLYNLSMSQVAVDSQIWNFQEIGEGKRTPIVILHGWGRSGNEWVHMAEELSAWSGRKAYVLDLPGFGGSSMSEVKSIDAYTQLVVGFCRYMKISKVRLICHSLGARVGIVWASGHDKEMIEQLILVDPAGPKEFSLKRAILSILARMFAFVPKGIRRAIVSPALDEDYRSTPELRKLYRVVVAKNLRSNLTQIKIPVRLIWGELDKIVPLRMVKVYQKLLSDIQVRIVWGAGHDPHLTKYEATLAILQEDCE